MRKEEAERILEGYLKPVLGFTLKRCKSSEDAENLSRKIILKAYRVLLVRDDLEDAGKFIRTVAHNALSCAITTGACRRRTSMTGYMHFVYHKHFEFFYLSASTAHSYVYPYVQESFH